MHSPGHQTRYSLTCWCASAAAYVVDIETDMANGFPSLAAVGPPRAIFSLVKISP